jgi:hypothetical protein
MNDQQDKQPIIIVTEFGTYAMYPSDEIEDDPTIDQEKTS